MVEPNPKRPRTVAGTDGAPADTEGLALMLTDVEEEPNGIIRLWGVGPRQQTVLVVVPDYQPYFYLPCPFKSDTGAGSLREPSKQELKQLKQLLNARWGACTAPATPTAATTAATAAPCHS